MPAPVFVKPPEVVPMIDASEPLLAPVSVNPKVAPVMVPAAVRFSVPASEEMVDAEPSEIRPLKVLVPLTLTKAPVWPARSPAPFSTMAAEAPAPCSWRVAPEATVTPVVLPSAEASCKFRMPALTATAPVTVFATARVTLPLSIFARLATESPFVLTTRLPPPPRVRFRPAPTTPPVRVRVPLSELIWASPPSVIAPESVFAPRTLRIAPGLRAKP